jgi:hypothetical protein
MLCLSEKRYLLLSFHSITKNDILYKKCSDISSHILIDIAIIIRLKALFIAVLKNSSLINLSIVLQTFTFAIPPYRIHQYGKWNVGMFISYWNNVRSTLGKRTKDALDFNDKSRKYNFLLLPIILIIQKCITPRYRGRSMYL